MKVRVGFVKTPTTFYAYYRYYFTTLYFKLNMRIHEFSDVRVSQVYTILKAESFKSEIKIINKCVYL